MKATPVLLVLFLVLAGGSKAELVDEVYSYSPADPEEVEAVLSQALTANGKMVILKDRSKVLIKDEPATHEMVKILLADMTKPRPNVKVEVMFNEDTLNTDRGVEVGWSVGGRDVQVGGGSPPQNRNSANVNLSNRTTSTSRRSGQFLVVQSGRSASIRVVQEVPFVDYFYNYAWGHGYITSQTRWESIGSQMSVRPRVRGNLIEVELMPQITALVDGQRQIIDYRELATTVTLADGKEVSLGGFQGAGDEFNRNFFSGSRRTSSTQNSGFTIRASIFQY